MQPYKTLKMKLVIGPRTTTMTESHKRHSLPKVLASKLEAIISRQEPVLLAPDPAWTCIAHLICVESLGSQFHSLVAAQTPTLQTDLIPNFDLPLLGP